MHTLSQYLIVSQHEDIFVGQEHLERVDSFLFGQDLHLFLHLLTPPGHSNMEGVVTAHLRVCPASPAIILLEERFILGSKHKVN